MSRKPFILSGGTLLDPAQEIEGPGDILVEDGLIRGVDKPGAFAGVKDAVVIDVKGQLVTPGLLDVHTHLREPGFEWKETVATGAAAAAAGGFTAICAMPNTKPVNDSASITQYMLKQARDAGLARVLPIGAITCGLEGKDLAPMVELREAGCAAFSDDGMPVWNAGVMRRALEYSKMLGAVLACHEEETSLCEEWSMHEGVTSLRMGLKGMPAAAENVMISRDIELVHLTKGRAHFCHVSTARGAILIRRAKEDGISVTAEVTPHHLTLTESAVEGYNTNAKMNPPLRTEEDVAAVIEALRDGVIDCMASDHAPHEADSKNCEFPKASNGILGLQTNVPLTLALVRAGKLSRRRAVESWTSSPARCLNLPVNRLKAGALADITVIDENRKLVLTGEYLRSLSKNTPYLGKELQGIAVKTIVGGVVVYDLEKK